MLDNKGQLLFRMQNARGFEKTCSKCRIALFGGLNGDQGTIFELPPSTQRGLFFAFCPKKSKKRTFLDVRRILERDIPYDKIFVLFSEICRPFRVVKGFLNAFDVV